MTRPNGRHEETTMKAVKPTRQNPGKLITALEKVITDYRAGKGDILNRVADGGGADDGDVSLEVVLARALFGSRSVPEPPKNGGSVLCTKREHAALAEIGSGSAERGAEVVVAAALAWAKRDRPGMVAWASTALPKLESIDLGRISKAGMFGAELWQVTLRQASWWAPVQDVTDDAQKAAGAECDCADAVVRAMALAWHHRDFPGRVFSKGTRTVAPAA